MTTGKQTEGRSDLRLPDIPRREPDEVTAYDHLQQLANAHPLAIHLIAQGGDPESQRGTADRRTVQDLPSSASAPGGQVGDRVAVAAPHECGAGCREPCR